MFNIKSINFKKMIYMFIIIGILIPIVVNVFMLFSTPIDKGSIDSWIGFFGNYFGGIFGAIVGGTVGGLFAYTIAKHQIDVEREENKTIIEVANNAEKEKLIKDLQIKTTELLLNKISDVKEFNSRYRSSFQAIIAFLDRYNEDYGLSVLQKTFKASEVLKQAANSRDFWVAKISECMMALSDYEVKLFSSLHELYNVFITRRIILNKFENDFEEIHNIRIDLISLFISLNVSLTSIENSVKAVGELNIKDIDNLLEIYNEKCLNLLYKLYCNLWKLDTSIQNEFFSDLFGTTISSRHEGTEIWFDKVVYKGFR